MEQDTSPDHFSPDHPPSPGHSNSPLSPGEMATMVANGSVSNMPGPLGPINKRYRPAPAKTFQCRGYGECRMVFSRSEHLARHIRKHTGERPFSCHCNKQFSRLDNLRQHAQTVHADKQEQNERMMRDLTSLHATIAAQNKANSGRGSRRAAPVSTMATSATSATGGSGSPIHEEALVKQEEIGALPMHQRPGTSTGYEGEMMYPSWETEERRGNNGHNHSFRDPGQSFLAPSATSSTAAAAAAQSHSFRALASGSHRPGSSSSRPPTASGLADPHHPRSLPPLAAVVSNSLPSPSPHQPLSAHLHQHNHHPQSLFPFPGSLDLRRPSTATRPGTAPASASFFSSRPFSSGGSALGTPTPARPDLSLLHSGFGRSSSSGFSKEHLQHLQLGAAAGGYDPAAPGEVPTSPAGHDASPFFFSPPALDPSPAPSTTTTSPSSGLNSNNPRKRAFAGPDGPFDDAATPSSSASTSHTLCEPPGSSSGLADAGGYDYGSESRPQSRRLSVMELCNDADALAATARPASSHQRADREQYVPRSGAFLLSASAAAAAAAAGGSNAGYGYGYGGHGGGGGSSRPTTSSGLVSSTSTLHIFDRASPPPQPATAQVLGRTPSSTAGAAGASGLGTSSSSSSSSAAAASGGNGYQELRGSGVYSTAATSFRSVSGPAATTTAATTTPSPSSPTPASTANGSILSSSTYRPPTYPQQQYQFAHSPTFSAASSAASYSPRSPVSDGSGSASPFSPYLQPRSPIHDAATAAAAAAALSRARGDAGSGSGSQASQQQQQLDGQVRIPVSPHAAASFGMRV